MNRPRRPVIPPRAHLVASAALATAACGGNAIFYDDGEGGGGSSGTVGLPPGVGGVGNQGGFGNVGVGGDGGAPPPPPIPPLVEIPFADVPLGSSFTVEIPENALGFTVIADTGDMFDMVGIESIVSPSGVVAVSDFTIPGTAMLFDRPGIVAASVPQRSELESMPFTPGNWTIGVDSEDGFGSASVSVWYRQSLDGAFHGGVLDVNLFVVQGLAPQDYIESMLELAYDGHLGLELGTVSVFQLPAQFGFIDDSNFFDAMHETAGAPGRPALNVVVVGGFGGSLEGAAGVSSGLPIQPLEHGTNTSGIFWQVTSDTTLDTMILRHEAGHAGGLLHTSEFEIGFGDALGDTPFCNDVLTQGPGCPDFDNLMFPTGGSGAFALTSQQRTVVEASLLYRGIVERGGAPAGPLPQAIAPPPSPWSSAWTTRLPAMTSAALAGFDCAEQGVGVPLDVARRIRAAAGGDRPALLAVGRDRTASPFVRGRALLAAGGAGAPSAVVDALASIAADGGETRLVRMGAFLGVRGAAPARGRALATALTKDVDPALAEMGARYTPAR